MIAPIDAGHPLRAREAKRRLAPLTGWIAIIENDAVRRTVAPSIEIEFEWLWPGILIENALGARARELTPERHAKQGSELTLLTSRLLAGNRTWQPEDQSSEKENDEGP